MYTTQYLLLCILILLSLGAVICFSLFVIKPLQTHWALARARKIIASGNHYIDRNFRTVYRMLATSRNDLEAAKLWHRLDEIKEASTHHNHHEFMQLVGIIPPGGKLKRSRS
jgi:hypothetical protein